MAEKMKKRNDGRYVSRVTLPGGEKIDVYGKTQREVKDQIDEIKLKYAMGTTSIKNKIILTEWANIWWDTVKKSKTGG